MLLRDALLPLDLLDFAQEVLVFSFSGSSFILSVFSLAFLASYAFSFSVLFIAGVKYPGSYLFFRSMGFLLGSRSILIFGSWKEDRLESVTTVKSDLLENLPMKLDVEAEVKVDCFVSDL